MADVLAGDDGPPRTAELSEVLNYVETAELAYNALADGHRLSLMLITELHARLVRGTAADTRDAGRVRTIQVAIGGQGARISDARFVPGPPGLELEASLRDLLDWVNRSGSDRRDPVVSAALAHYQFETLHPFNDGNGRLGRLTIVLGLLQERVIREPLLTVSPWFEARRSQYQDQLSDLSATGDWSRWVEFFATGLGQSALETVLLVRELLAISEDFDRRLREAGVRGVAQEIARSLIAKAITTVREAAEVIGRGYQTASTAITRLAELGIVESYGAAYPKRFAAMSALKALGAL